VSAVANGPKTIALYSEKTAEQTKDRNESMHSHQAVHIQSLIQENRRLLSSCSRKTKKRKAVKILVTILFFRFHCNMINYLTY
jgi:hypothetical protein